MTAHTGTLQPGDLMPTTYEFAGPDGMTWQTDSHRAAGQPLLLILHRHLA